MLVLRFKGPDYNSITRQIFNVGFRFLKQPYTKISKNMKKNINSLIIYLEIYKIIYRIYKN